VKIDAVAYRRDTQLVVGVYSIQREKCSEDIEQLVMIGAERGRPVQSRENGYRLHSKKFDETFHSRPLCMMKNMILVG